MRIIPQAGHETWPSATHSPVVWTRRYRSSKRRSACESQAGEDHPATLSVWQPAEGYRSAGRLDEAMPLMEETLRLRKAKLGDDHPDTLNSMNNLAAGLPVSRSAGRGHTAVGRDAPPAESQAGRRTSRYADQHEQPGQRLPVSRSAGRGDTAVRRDVPPAESQAGGRTSRHADQHEQPGHRLPIQPVGWTRRCTLWEETLRLRKAKLGDDHPDTLTSMNNLAGGYYAAGRLDEAIPLWEETLRLRKAKLGDEHPDTLTSMNNLAAGYRSAGRLEEAIPLYEETLRLCKAKLGDEHPDTLISMNNLATCYRSAGRLDEAIPLLRRDAPPAKSQAGRRSSRDAEQHEQPGRQLLFSRSAGRGDTAAGRDAPPVKGQAGRRASRVR